MTTDLTELGKRRSEMLAFLTDTDVFTKYRQVSDELVGLKADISPAHTAARSGGGEGEGERSKSDPRLEAKSEAGD